MELGTSAALIATLITVIAVAATRLNDAAREGE
jgi:hypothetical protein